MDPKYLPHATPRSKAYRIAHDRVCMHIACAILGAVLSVAATYLGVVNGIVVHIVIPSAGSVALTIQELLDRILSL